MLETFRNAWKVQDLRKKILFTLFIILIYRIGCAIPVPFLSGDGLQSLLGDGSNIFSLYNEITGGAFSEASLFALGITPYINASIIMQLLTYALPPLERLQKEGESGRKKINKITRYVSLAIGLFQSTAFYFTLKNNDAVLYSEGATGIFTMAVIILAFTAGASLIIWMGEQVNQKGIGNGISMILFAGIIARVPENIINLFKQASVNKGADYFYVPLVLIIFVVMIGFIILMNNAERRIPIQYAKRVVGRKMYGGQNTHIPIKVAMSGVMPIIFAMSFMALPATLEMFFPVTNENGFYAGFINLFKTNSWFYAALYLLLIIGFNYFYVSMQYNPIEISNNLRQNNGGIPGIRPGRPTSDFISRVLSKITLVGAIFLGIIAIFPIIFTRFTGVQIAMGGTTILIIVSVALETVRTLESQMMMRHHKGFLE